VPKQISEDAYNELKYSFLVNKEHEWENRQRAFKDVLTGYPNGILFSDCLERAITEAQADGSTVVVLCLRLGGIEELDCTTEIKEKFIVEAGQRISEVLRRCDTVARAGFSEYMVLAKDFVRLSAINNVVNRILSALRKPFAWENGRHKLKVHVGCAFYPFDGEEQDSLISSAKKALIAVDEDCKYSFELCSFNIKHEVLERLKLTNQLYSAIDNKELELYYQPQVDSFTGEITGLESLIRWNHPERGIVMPTEFIPIAERTGLILQIGNWVTEEACRQSRVWHDMGYHLPQISVNLSVRQFEDPGLTANLARILQKTGLDPEFLQVEITESISLLNMYDLAKKLLELNALGLGIALDDFGIGCSSLYYLKVVPACTIKIDKSFIQGIGIEERDETIIHSVIEMAKGLGINVVAEGVETKEQLEFLRREGCDEIQGFYFFRPMPARQVEKLLKKKS